MCAGSAPLLPQLVTCLPCHHTVLFLPYAIPRLLPFDSPAYSRSAYTLPRSCTFSPLVVGFLLAPSLPFSATCLPTAPLLLPTFMIRLDCLRFARAVPLPAIPATVAVTVPLPNLDWFLLQRHYLPPPPLCHAFAATFWVPLPRCGPLFTPGLVVRYAVYTFALRFVPCPPHAHAVTHTAHTHTMDRTDKRTVFSFVSFQFLISFVLSLLFLFSPSFSLSLYTVLFWSRLF